MDTEAESLRCLLVDDEEISRMMLEELVKQTKLLVLVASCSDPMEAQRILQKEPVDLIFLDVEMPGMTGLDLIKTMARKPEIILVTGREEYAVEAFDLEVTDYIVKPVTLSRFVKAVNRVFERRTAVREAKQSESTQDALYVKVRTQLVKIPIDQVLWVESAGDYVTIHTGGEKFIAHATMKEMERRLPPTKFVRVHRSFIVQLARIKAIEETVIIIEKTLIPIGDTYRSALMSRLNLL